MRLATATAAPLAWYSVLAGEALPLGGGIRGSLQGAYSHCHGSGILTTRGCPIPVAESKKSTRSTAQFQRAKPLLWLENSGDVYNLVRPYY